MWKQFLVILKELCCFVSNGEDWWRLRSGFQRSLSRVQDVRLHLPATDTIMQEFIQFATISHNDDFLPKLSRLYLECEFLPFSLFVSLCPAWFKN